MLNLKNIYKYYKYGKYQKTILDNINISFNDQGMVFILGASGSGKTTLLNIMAGNLRSDRGEISLDNELINNKSDKYLNSYRNKIIGYIYQDYNLIEYLSVYDNIMLACTGRKDSEYLNTLLEQLDLTDKKYMIVSKLSGGEKQRVAIIRALINKPQIILADEPTGAVDSETGLKIMEILKRISKKRLVIVVSHDQYLASKYANQIINIKDGKIINQNITNETNNEKSITKDMKYHHKINSFKIRKLSFKNLWLKKGRTIMTILAMSLGIISMTLVISLTNNFNKELTSLEEDLVSVFPVSIKSLEYIDNLVEMKNNDKSKIYVMENNKYLNKINEEYLTFLDSLDIDMNKVYSYDLLGLVISDLFKVINEMDMKIIPSSKYVDDNYEIVSGRMIENEFEILLKIDNNNMISHEIMNYFGLDKEISYEKVIGRSIKFIPNDLYYQKNGDYYYQDNDYQKLYRNSEIKLTIVGIIREKTENIGGSFIYYDEKIFDEVFDINHESRIVNSQLKNDYNVLGLDINKDEMLKYLGYYKIPSGIDLYGGIDLYVNSIKDKDKLISRLDTYNKQNDKVIYEDAMASSIKIVKDFINIISLILTIFSIVSIIISLLMISILTSVRVLERRKEIGIIRSLGASRRDIRKLFNTENMLIGLLSSVIGIIVLYIFTNPINNLINELIGLDNLLVIEREIVILIIIFNIIIVRLAGSIPAIRASKLEITKCIYDR